MLYVDHRNRRTTYADPRLAFATEIVEENPMLSEFRQRFDASSKALQVLHGVNLTGKSALITGASSGVGFETARALACHGCHVLMAVRDLNKGQKAVEAIRRDRPHAECSLIPVELTSLKSVSTCAERVKEHCEHLDALILNAGVFGIDFCLTEDGLEQMFQVNYLSHVYLAHLLKPLLGKDRSSRVVFLSAESHRFASLTSETISSYSAVSPVSSNSFPSSIFAYNNSKLLCLMFSLEADARRTRKWNQVQWFAVHPGNMVSGTGLSRNWWLYRLLFTLVRPFAKSAEQAAGSVAFAAFAPEAAALPMTYVNNCFPCVPSALARDQVGRDAVWKLTQDILREKVGDEELEL